MQSPTIRMSFLLQIAIRKGFAGMLRSLISYGGDGGIRTHDLLNANQALSQLSYAPIIVLLYHIIKTGWKRRRFWHSFV
jgi:hypothetical protein